MMYSSVLDLKTSSHLIPSPLALPLAVECPLLSDPADGRVLVTDRTFTNNATYECDEGFFLSGMTSRQCQADMTWSGTEPDCIGEWKT